MKLRELIFLIMLILFCSKTVFSGEAEIVNILPAEPVALTWGETAQLSVRAKIKEGFHVQANPASEEFLIATTLTLQNVAGIINEAPVYPPGIPYRMMGSDEELLTYEDEFIIEQPVKVLKSASPGRVEITGKLRYQPCDDRKCLFPRSIPVIIPVEVIGPPK